jgi:hypothetical protein
MSSVSFVPDINMQTDDIKGRTELAFNLCMHGGSPTTCCNIKETKTHGVLRRVEW